MDFIAFFGGIAAVAVALCVIKYTTPNQKHH